MSLLVEHITFLPTKVITMKTSLSYGLLVCLMNKNQS